MTEVLEGTEGLSSKKIADLAGVKRETVINLLNPCGRVRGNFGGKLVEYDVYNPDDIPKILNNPHVVLERTSKMIELSVKLWKLYDYNVTKSDHDICATMQTMLSLYKEERVFRDFVNKNIKI